ncbi:hypothetical protein Ancab_029832 [Ancistrocladus abbreviatus]
MERDLVGLVPKKPSSVTVKQESDDSIACSNSEPMAGSRAQWSFLSKTTNSSNILSFNSARGGIHKLYSPGGVQRNLPIDKQAGSHLPTTGYTRTKFDTHSLSHPHEKKIFPVSSQASQMVSVAMSSPAPQSHLVPTGQDPFSSLSVGVASMVSPVPVVPANSASVGSTSLGSSMKSSSGPAQLTVFYNGLVCVYDDVSFEKAQAIMLLAGNGNSKNHSAAVPASKAQPQVPKPTAADGAIVTQTTGFSTAVSMFLPVGLSSAGLPSAAVEVKPVKPAAVSSPQNNKPELPRVVASCETGAVKLASSGVPQARKESLARFLEKRKERVLSASPYNNVARTLQGAAFQSGVDQASFTLNSATS